MITINLREYYPEIYKSDNFIQVTDEVAAFMLQEKLNEKAAKELTRVHKAYFSLDYGNEVEKYAIVRPETPYEIMEQMIKKEILYEALNSLSPTQKRRILKNIVEGIDKAEIAAAEGVDESSVRESIKGGLTTVGFDPGTGKQIQRSVTGKTQKEVSQKLREITHELDTGDYIEPVRTTVQE